MWDLIFLFTSATENWRGFREGNIKRLKKSLEQERESRSAVHAMYQRELMWCFDHNPEVLRW